MMMDNANQNNQGSSTKRNLAAISVAFLGAYTSLSAVSNLQSSINTENDVGIYSLVTMGAGAVISTLFFTTAFESILGYKWSIFIGQLGILAYILVNMYPTMALMLPVGALSGILCACMWSAKSSYINKLGHDDDYDDRHGNSDSKINKYIDIFFIVFQTSQIWANLIAYGILKNTPQNATSNWSQCGGEFLESEHQSGNNSRYISQSTFYILYGILAGIVVLSILYVIMFLKQKRDQETKVNNFQDLVHKQYNNTLSIIKELVTPNHLLLAPLAFWTAASEAFAIGTFSESFIACTIGVQYIGLIGGIYGIVLSGLYAIMTYMSKLKYSRPPYFIFAIIVSYVILIVMYRWIPNPSQTYLLYILPCLSGLSDAITHTYVTGFYNNLFPTRRTTAFSIFIIFQSLAFVVVYSYTSAIRVRISIILQFVYISVAVICYLILEIRDRRTSNNEEERPLVRNNVSIMDNTQ